MAVKAILFDLDDTLLDTNMDRFIPKYLDALGYKMKHLMDAKKLIDLVLESTYMMVKNQDPKLTNEQVFYNHFYPRTNFSRTEFQLLIEEFYEIDFPKLKVFTNPIPFAAISIQALYDEGYKIAIATNPLFPAKAIYHRINWAGLSHIKFDLITTYDNSHFCKPNHKYYLEILEKMDLKPDQAVMIGDDYNNDIIPAQSIGIRTFFINSTSEKGKSGSLQDCFDWIKSGFK
ncbi:MAG: HAD family hydrolase [Calditrichaceae bacterium]|nr:HAD family hydrolase [Calditrichaceae bacterium]